MPKHSLIVKQPHPRLPSAQKNGRFSDIKHKILKLHKKHVAHQSKIQARPENSCQVSSIALVAIHFSSGFLFVPLFCLIFVHHRVIVVALQEFIYILHRMGNSKTIAMKCQRIKSIRRYGGRSVGHVLNGISVLTHIFRRNANLSDTTVCRLAIRTFGWTAIGRLHVQSISIHAIVNYLFPVVTMNQ